MSHSRFVLLFAALAACGGSEEPTDCPDAHARLGYRPCAHSVGSAADWAELAKAVTPVDQVRTTRYMVPARDDARLPALFEDSSAPFAGHYQFLKDAFGERFPALTLQEYVELITHPQRREFFAGSVTEYLKPDGTRVFGFIVWDTQTEDGTATCAELRAVHATVEESFVPEPLAVVPTTDHQRAVLEDCDVPWYDAARALEYEGYTLAVGYGTIRRYRLDQLADATTRAEFGFQDILVIDQAPFDIETVISGAITGTRQGELSHLNVRSSSRGTPNCYLRGAYDVMAAWDGELVRIECKRTGLTVAAATTEEAEEHWQDLRPDPVDVPDPDPTFTALTQLLDIPTATAADRLLGVRRFGAKASNLGALYQRVDSARQLDGFAIPVAYYHDFLHTHGFDETIAAHLADEQFLTDGAVRREKLWALRQAMRQAACDDQLLAAIDGQIRATFGSPEVMVRFRSSSNAEDALAFNGAGLYSSTSVCLTDDLDDDADGPSRCDPDQPKERGLCRGLTKVWASTWKPQAFDERAWYGIDHAEVAMGILVNTRTKGELANIVAFTGNPLGPDVDAYLINAQKGELDVVSSEPGVWPEKDLLTLDGGEVTAIERARASTEVGEGEVVLDDARLRELGATLWTIEEVYPVDAAPPAGKRVLLDTEWKIRSDGQLVVKQVRPFLD